jgi:ethanolamine-phosphate phospho-lyase
MQRTADMSPRDPVRVEWAPEAAVEFSGSSQKQAGAGKPAVALTADASGAGRAAAATTQAILERRRKHVGPNLALFFQEEPLHIVRGQGCELFDPEGNCYLDCINNVSHVGHAHPGVAAAVSTQLFTLNTNSRYLHEAYVEYAEAMAALCPDPLQVLYMLTSGSEANDLAWRIACAAAAAANPDDSRPLHVAVVDHAYHGHTSLCIDLSPYKWKGPGGGGRPAYVHVLPCPDVYRGQHLDGAAGARAAIAEAEAAGGRIAAFFSESILSCGGQVWAGLWGAAQALARRAFCACCAPPADIKGLAPALRVQASLRSSLGCPCMQVLLPPGYLEGVYQEMRAAGAVCVADEVQCGFGRVGRTFWAFELQGVVPDIVTFGKPCGNGWPMAGLITSPRLAEAFSAPGMEFFATGGGCTAAPTCGLAVLAAIREERLQDNAASVGAYCLRRLHQLQAQHPDVIGDVRGEGLMIGIEMITDPQSKAHSPALARHLKLRCKADHRVLLSSEGPFASVIKVKPPICFTEQQADRMVDAMAAVLAALAPEDKACLAEASRAEVQAVSERHARLW